MKHLIVAVLAVAAVYSLLERDLGCQQLKVFFKSLPLVLFSFSDGSLITRHNLKYFELFMLDCI